MASRLDIAVTSVARSCIDLTREAGLLHGLVATDAALHARLITVADLEAVCASCRGRAGLSSGRRVLELCSGLSESPLETISLFAMQELSRQPEQQVNLFTVYGQFLGRADFYWRAEGLAGEADGRTKYDDDELYREKRRQEAMADAGLVVTRWDWSTARRPGLLHAQLEEQLARARLARRGGYPLAVEPLGAA
jgi:hypothetical protein